MGSAASKKKRAAQPDQAPAATPTARSLAVAPQKDALSGMDLGGMTAATVTAVGNAAQTWNASGKGDSTVSALVSFVTSAVPGFAATLGALGEHAPLVGVVFSVLKVAGAYVADVAATKAAYEQFATAVITTTRLVLQVEEFQKANKVTLPKPVQSALSLYWKQLDAFAALLVHFRDKNYAKHLFGKGAQKVQLNVVRIAIEQAARDLDRTGILTSVVQNQLILENQAAAKKQLDAMAKKQDRSLELQEASSGKLDRSLELQEASSGKMDKVLELAGSAAGSAAGRVWTIATTAGEFVGRAAELATLEKALRPASDKVTATRVAISGMGGTGKSTLAQRAAERAAGRFTSGWTLDGSNEAALLAGLGTVARDLKLGDLKQDEIVPAVQSRLSKADVAGWLVVVDNVDDAAFKAKLPSLLPTVGGCLLVTSRLADWDGWTRVTLGIMSDQEATQLLGGAPADAAPIAAVVKQLGGLPVALEQAKAYVQKVKIAWAKYVDKLAAQAAKGVLPSLQLSLQAVLEQEPSIGTVLQLLQVLHPDDIPRSLLTATVEKLAPGVDVDELVAELAGFSIVTFTAETVSLHRLMQEAMRIADGCQLHVAVTLNVIMEAVVDEGKIDNPPLMRRLLVHYGELTHWFEQKIPNDTEVALAYQACGAIYVYSFRDYAKGRVLLERALTIQENKLGTNDVTVAKTLRHLAFTYDSLDDAVAKMLLERALAIEECQYGLDHVEVSKTLMFLGWAYYRLGNGTKAIELLERSLAIKERHLGPDHVEVAFSLGNLGTVYGSLGDHAKNKVLSERCLVIEELHFGADHPEIAVLLHNLGNVYGALGDNAKKIALLERSLSMMERHYGPENSEVARTLTSLGNAYGDLGDAAKQKALLERALAIKERHYGPDHAEVAITVFNLGNAHKALGNMNEARKCMERCLAIETAYYGADHPNTKFTVAAIAELPPPAR